MSNGERPPEPRRLFYILSFIVPPAGIRIAVIYLTKADVAAVVACCLCYVPYFFDVFGLIGLSGALS